MGAELGYCCFWFCCPIICAFSGTCMPLLTTILAKSRCQTEKMAPSSREQATTPSLDQFPCVDSPTLTALTRTAKEEEGGRKTKTRAMKSYGLLVWLHLINADLSPKTYWQRPRSQEVNGRHPPSKTPVGALLPG